MLALKDKDGVVESSMVGLADSAKVSVEECRRAVGVLLSPDPNDTSKVEEGRRIREVAGGWQIVNHELYRYSSDHQRAYWAAQKADQRARKVDGQNGVQKKRRRRGAKDLAVDARQAAYVKAKEEGDERGANDAVDGTGMWEEERK